VEGWRHIVAAARLQLVIIIIIIIIIIIDIRTAEGRSAAKDKNNNK